MKLSYTGGLKLTQQKRERQVYFSVYELFVLLYCSYISSSVKFFCYLKKKKTWSTFLSGQAYVVLLADGAKIYWISDHFFYQGFLHRHWRFTGQQGKEGDHLLFHSTTSTRSRTLRHLFVTLHVRWLSRQTATRWDLPPYRITIWVIDWWCNVCLFTWWIDTRFLL